MTRIVTSADRYIPDPDPSMPCAACGEHYDYDDYWKGRYVEPDDVNECERDWLCDECIKVQEREANNHELMEFQA